MDLSALSFDFSITLARESSLRFRGQASTTSDEEFLPSGRDINGARERE